ncbi:hypothetical protein K493DRAFT_380575 [Basidiobolus meristosporus CBS 931.73]|uniref:Uncharacterized protein n=1 Tax=Basidiobolus meristosporus CBS 931.73 TaxID=1314790 RepID=A0A1Y1XYS9_9FUNG|nr:hypothetical protein K493DRAFT_380575 [Basidiobolus meristosporus CBS 931.73]|eukprot:ORX90524.1 hypothetical protein K493DRAFT_380575 [Basidiobolus meristosporus CBS 931.73]
MIIRLEGYWPSLFIVTLLSPCYVVAAYVFPSEKRFDTTGDATMAFLEDWGQPKARIAISSFQLGCSIVIPVIALLTCGYLAWKKWKQGHETKRRIKLAIKYYFSNGGSGHGTVEEPPVYSRRSSQPVLPAPIVKKIDDAIYNEITSTERPPKARILDRNDPPMYTPPPTSPSSTATLPYRGSSI